MEKDTKIYIKQTKYPWSKDKEEHQDTTLAIQEGTTDQEPSSKELFLR